MINIPQFRANIVRPTLEAIGAHNRVAEDLVLGTALQESNLHYLRQLNQGPARGVYQMEPATHDDIWEDYLAFRAELRTHVSAFLAPEQGRVDQLVWNLAYATAMCRVHYLRVPHPLPDPGDIRAMGEYWKRHYNTLILRPSKRARPSYRPPSRAACRACPFTRSSPDADSSHLPDVDEHRLLQRPQSRKPQ